MISCRLLSGSRTTEIVIAGVRSNSPASSATGFRSRLSAAKSDAYKVHALVRILFAQPQNLSISLRISIFMVAGIVPIFPRVSSRTNASTSRA